MRIEAIVGAMQFSGSITEVVTRPAVIPLHFDSPVRLDDGPKLVRAIPANAMAHSPTGRLAPSIAHSPS